jgi:membrane protein YdbS with pleckstrin-like domain
MQCAKTTWRFLSGIGMLVMLVLGIIIMAMGIAVGVQAGSPTPASSMVVALGVFVILGAINFTFVRPPDN